MSKSARLRSDDGRAIISLVNESRELGIDWKGWQEHWTGGLLKLIDADLGLIGEMADAHKTEFRMIGPPMIQSALGFLFNPDRIMEAIERYGAIPNASKFVAEYMGRLRKDDGIALSNRDFYQDREWRSSADMEIMGEAFGTDASMICMHFIKLAGNDRSLNVTISRAKGRKNFSARDCTTVREAVAAITPLIGGPLARFADPSPADLAPRVRQVLACFLEGDGDKQVAARLGISVHTVNQYAKVIFQHFGVRSRTELLARWIRRGWGNKFSWVE